MKPASYLSLLARSYLHTHDAPTSLRSIIRLTYAGISIGALSLMLAFIITRGFERDISKKLKNVNSDIIIASPGNSLDADAIKKHIQKSMGRHIAGMSASVTRHIMIEHKENHHVVFLKGIAPADETKTTTLGSKIITPKKGNLCSLLAPSNSIIVGNTLAHNLRLSVGDAITVLIPEKGRSRSLYLEKRTVTIGGIFSLGLDEYDSNVAYCTIETLSTLYGEPITTADQLAINLKERHIPTTRISLLQQARNWLGYFIDSDDRYYKRLVRKTKRLLRSLVVRGWDELYPDLVASLTLEKYAMTIVLALIALVASMLMICLLFMFIQYKRHDIAILRALGASNDDIYRLFQKIGMTIVLKSSLFGLSIAAGIGWWLETYKPIELPGVYIVTYLPAALEPTSFIIIFAVILCLGMLACRIPLQQLKNSQVTELFREN